MSSVINETDYRALASRIDECGWQQFSFAKVQDHLAITGGSLIEIKQGERIVLVTHSCDLIHHSEQELEAEFVILEPMAETDNKALAKQSPRLRIVHAYAAGAAVPILFRTSISRRFFVRRQKLDGLTPDSQISLRSNGDLPGFQGKSERHLTEWLAGRYNRGWTPTEFDRRLKRGVGKIQQCLERMVKHGAEDIFIRVTPQEELRSTNETYEITLVILVDPVQESKLGAIRAEANTLSTCLRQLGIL